MNDSHRRSPQSIEADKRALRSWVKRLKGRRGSALRLVEASARLTLYDGETPVAAFALQDERWHLKWMRASGRWAPYDGRAYLTLAIPMVEVEADPDSVFWG